MTDLKYPSPPTDDQPRDVEVLYSVEPAAWLVWVIVSGFVAVLAGLVAALWALATGTGLAVGLALWGLATFVVGPGLVALARTIRDARQEAQR